MKEISFGRYFKLVFVIFSLYLMGDAFYRWDGFSKYAAFSEFLPGLSLVSILWCTVALFIAIFTWLLFRLLEWLSHRAGLKLQIEHLLLFVFLTLLSGAAAWKGKKLVWPFLQTTPEIKLTVFFCIALVSGILTWSFRNKAEEWLDIASEKITPLIWLFGIFVFCSIPIVAYHTLFKEAGTTVQQSVQASIIDKNKPNILLVTFDSLTARNMSVYGYEKETTPFIKKWAKGAALFNRTEAASNFTTSATASLLPGKRVWTHQSYHIEGTKPLNSSVESLPALLKEHGYYNMAFIVNPHTSVRILGMEKSFDIAPPAYEFSEPASLVGWQFGALDVLLYKLFADKIRMHDWILKDDFILKKLLYRISNDFTLTTVPIEKVFSASLDVMGGTSQRPFFVWIHVFPPHDPYLPPEPYKYMYNSSSWFRTWKSQEQVKVESYKYLFQYKWFPEEMQPAVDLMKDYYDEFIKYGDEKFKELITGLNDKGLDNTIVILSADHGESFEHGYFTHGGPFLYEQVTHIPLIIKAPGQKNAGRVINVPVGQIDIPATILELADIPVPSWMEGRSLVPFMNGDELPNRPLFSMNFEENPSRGSQIKRGSIAVWDNDYKLIHYLGKKEFLLFNLKIDPDESDNIIEKEPEISQRLLNIIKSKLNEANKQKR